MMSSGKALSERQAFEAALQFEEVDREVYLRELGGEDAELEQRVRALLEAHSASALSTTQFPGARTPGQPERNQVGPYRLLQQLAEGGMGIVYVAEQTKPVRRKVALKLIKSSVKSRELLGRFHAECQALALMSHPNIARILDAGSTDDGLPYLVMEYVQGVPLLEYCDGRHLSIDHRLLLFVDICLAVQHAHQKGVIHRDLKPSNILVEEVDGQLKPKVIDFGVAKALHQRLTDYSVHTRLGGFIGTPDYVSPEQAETTAQDIDTRADIYSLGAVLYELLCGLTPFDFRRDSIAEIQRILAEREPKPPSTRVREGDDAASVRAQHRRTGVEDLHRALRGDLDWITLKALAKDRTRRYSSASELAADLERHRSCETVLARPPSTMYRVERFVRRHSLLLAVAAIALLALVAGTIGTFLGLVRAREEAEQSRISAATAEEVNAFLNDDLLAAVAPEAQGIDVSMREVLDAASKRIDGRFPDQPVVEASLRHTIGRTYLALGVLDEAAPHLIRARDLFERNLGPEALKTRAVYLSLARLYSGSGRPEDARSELGKVLDPTSSGLVSSESIASKLADSDPAFLPLPGKASSVRLDALEQLAIVEYLEGRYEEAKTLFLSILKVREAISGRDAPETQQVLGRLAVVYRFLERWEEAEQIHRQMLAANQLHLGSEHPRTLKAVSRLAALYLGWGRNRDAEKLLVENLGPMRRIMGEHHPETLMMANNLGWMYLGEGRHEEARDLLSETYSVKRRVLGELHPSTVEGLENLVILYARMGEDGRHEEYLTLYVDTLRRVCDGPRARISDCIEYANLLLTAEMPELRDPERALAVALQAADKTDRQDAGVLAVLARAYEQTGDRASAVRTAREALKLAESSELRSQMAEILRSGAS